MLEAADMNPVKKTQPRSSTLLSKTATKAPSKTATKAPAKTATKAIKENATAGDPLAQKTFWDLAEKLAKSDPRIIEGSIMRCRCLRVGEEFLALVDYKGSGLVVKLHPRRVEELVALGVGQNFAPANKIFKAWISIPKVDKKLWSSLLLEGIETVAPGK